MAHGGSFIQLGLLSSSSSPDMAHGMVWLAAVIPAQPHFCCVLIRPKQCRCVSPGPKQYSYMSHSVLISEGAVPHSVLSSTAVSRSVLNIDAVSHSVRISTAVSHSVLKIDAVPHSVLNSETVSHSFLLALLFFLFCSCFFYCTPWGSQAEKCLGCSIIFEGCRLCYLSCSARCTGIRGEISRANPEILV
jgi:hypothetical protein